MNRLLDRYAKKNGFDNVNDFIDSEISKGNEAIMEELEWLLNEPELLEQELNNSDY